MGKNWVSRIERTAHTLWSFYRYYVARCYFAEGSFRFSIVSVYASVANKVKFNLFLHGLGLFALGLNRLRM